MQGGCVPKYSAVTQAAPGADTDIISGGFTVPEAGAIRISVAVVTASIFNLMVTPAGGSQVAIGLNSSVALAAGDGYTFPWSVYPKDQSGNILTYNFQVETNSVIRYLGVDFITSGVL